MFLICMLVASFGPAVFFLAVRQFHLEGETVQWIVSLYPHSVALEDRQAGAEMLVTYGELAAADMIMFSAIMWCGIFVFRRIFGRAGA
jgi:hypothetical protein